MSIILLFELFAIFFNLISFPFVIYIGTFYICV